MSRGTPPPSGALAGQPGGDVVAALAPLLGLLAMAAAFVLVILFAQPPAAKPADAPPDEFAAGRAMVILERLVGDGASHPNSTPANAAVAERISAELAGLGYAVEAQTAVACREAWALCGEVKNLLARLPGEGPAVLLTAHYDSVGAGPGAADDLAGVAAIMEIARMLKANPPGAPVIFLFSDGEELGLLGAQAFADDHPWARGVGAVVNLEANGTGGQSILFEATENNGWMVEAYLATAPRPVASSVADEIYRFLPFNTDLTVYEEAGLPGINFAFTEDHPQYHTPLDQPSNLDPGSVQHHGDNALASVRAFATLDLGHPSAGKLVYQDVAPGIVARWPVMWTAWLALTSVAAWLAVVAFWLRDDQMRIRSLAWSVPIFPLGLLASTAAGFGLGAGVSAFSGSPISWYATPAPMRTAVAAAALLCPALVAMAVARRAGFRALLAGCWLWWSLLTAGVALALPAASPPLLIPALVTAVTALVMLVSPAQREPAAWIAVATVGVFTAGLLWLWFARGSDYSALGPDLGPTVGVAVGMTASAWAPLLAAPAAGDRAWRWGLAGLALVLAAATIVALRMPSFSPERPDRLSLLHVQDHQSGEAFWAIDRPLFPAGSRVAAPASLLEAGPFSTEARRAFPWSSRVYLTAPAPAAPSAEAPIRLREEGRGDGGRLIRLEWPQDTAGTRGALYVPESAGLVRAELEGVATLDDVPAEDGFHRIVCVAPACNGRALTLEVEQAGPFTAYLARTSYGLPPEGNALVEARDGLAVPSGDGDVRIVIDHVALP